jgi:hypothetical protein
VHQKSVSVCVRRRVKGQPNVEMEEAVFGTFTQDLERLGQWLKERKVTQVAMESTGVTTSEDVLVILSRDKVGPSLRPWSGFPSGMCWSRPSGSSRCCWLIP